MTNRRDFLGILGAGAALPAILPPFPTNASLPPVLAEFDMSWVDQIAKPHKFVIDSASIDDASGLWRAVALMDQYKEAFGTYPNEMGAVLVLRHEAIILTMDHSHWEKDGVGEASGMKDRDDKWVTRNPVGPPTADARPSEARYTLQGFQAMGGIVLACNFAFGGYVVGKYRKDGVSYADARKEALTHLLPGVILQPSGFFATVRAQQAGCAAFFNG
ncbi:MAG: hypothetical protein ABI542_01650 [Gemmatimonadota bacterium]